MAKKVVIKVENLSKQYRLGEVGTGTISHDLNRWWYRIRGKEDPYIRVGEVNDRTQKGEANYVWALKDINFELKQGEVFGIVGKNGAGKSTLLKILSKVTAPTVGSIKAKGRISSLLEVGTGFHPELTGLENIYLNGAILGMTKKEIASRLDEIVDFAKVEKYLDTPVKRYSSGMMVRLGFAVAAHLEPEILIVDEVLAVGDAEFQAKCVGKMRDVSSKDGRTILFVSHNMASVKSLCTRGILLENGSIKNNGPILEIVETYLSSPDIASTFENIPESRHLYASGNIFFRKIKVDNIYSENLTAVPFESPIIIEFELEIVKFVNDIFFDIKIVSREGIELTISQSSWSDFKALSLSEGMYVFKAEIENLLQPGHYYITIGAHESNGTTISYLENIINFEVSNISYGDKHESIQGWQHGYFRPNTRWEKLN